MRLFFRQLYWELFRLFARRRTYIGFGVFLSVEVLFYFLWTREKSEARMATFISRIAGGFDDYFSALTLAFLIVVFTMLLLGTVFVALVAGDILAKETEDGNLRLILARPVSRLRLLIIKFISCQVYTSVLFLFVGSSALAVGLLERGWGGGMLVWTPDLPRVSLFGWNEGLIRYFVVDFRIFPHLFAGDGDGFHAGMLQDQARRRNDPDSGVFCGGPCPFLNPLAGLRPLPRLFRDLPHVSLALPALPGYSLGPFY